MKAVRRCRAVTASPAVDHIRVGSSDVQRLEHIQSCTAESRNMSAAQLVHLSAISLQCFFLLTKTKTTTYKMILKTKTLCRCWSNRSPGQTTPDVLSGFQHRNSLAQKVLSDQRLCPFLNRDFLKPFNFLRNTDPTCG